VVAATAETLKTSKKQSILTLSVPPDLNDADEPDLYYYDQQAADRIVNYFSRYMTHVKGALRGQPFDLLPWEENLVRRLFGWKKKADGLRRYRMAYVEVTAGSGKTTLAAGIGLYLTGSDGEGGPEVYCAACNREQAARVHDIACAMVDNRRALKKRFRVFKRGLIECPANMGIFRVLSADVKSKHGADAHGIIFDELHAQPNDEMWNTLLSRVRSRKQPLVSAITTAGFDKESICWKQHEYALKVADPDDPTSDDTFLGVIIGAGEEEDWKDRRVWARVNPSYPHTPTETFLETEFKRAVAMPSYENTFRRFYLNQWTEQEFRWMPMDEWNACAGSIDFKKLRARPCWGGLDLSESKDLTAFSLIWPPEGKDRLFSCTSYFWVPEDRIEKRSKQDRVPYDRWVREGWLRVCPGRTIDYMQVIQEIGLLADEFSLCSIAYDRWGTKLVVQLLAEEGLNMVSWGQGFASQNGPMRELERLVLDRRIAHGGHPILSWNIRNLVCRQDPAGNIKPDKSKSTERIDGAVALINAIGAMNSEWGPGQ